MKPPFVLIPILGFAALFSGRLPEDKLIPNDPYFKYQVSFLNPGGRIPIERMSRKPSPITLEAAAGIDCGITKAWAISTGSREVVVAALVLSVDPRLDAFGLKRLLLKSATPLPSLQGKVGCGGMVDAAAAPRTAMLSAG